MPKPLPPGTQIRQARLEDISSLADLLCLAPDDGSVYQYPYMLQYPNIWHSMHLGWLRPALQDSTTLIRIAALEDDNGSPKVIGYSSWKRWDPDPESPGQTKAGVISDVAALPDSVTEVATANAPVVDSASKKGLVRDEVHAAAVKRVRSRAPPSPTLTIPSYELNGLMVHPRYQGCGIGSTLAQWGLNEATKNFVPVFVAAEAQGVEFYRKAHGFRAVKGTEYWLDKDGGDISQTDVEAGNEAWKKTNGGVSGSQMLWIPLGYTLKLGGEEYSNQ